MASAAVEENLDSKVFYCHSCSTEVQPTEVCFSFFVNIFVKCIKNVEKIQLL